MLRISMASWLNYGEKRREAHHKDPSFRKEYHLVNFRNALFSRASYLNRVHRQKDKNAPCIISLFLPRCIFVDENNNIELDGTWKLGLAKNRKNQSMPLVCRIAYFFLCFK